MELYWPLKKRLNEALPSFVAYKGGLHGGGSQGHPAGLFAPSKRCQTC